jgi:hypothetical protein
MSTGGRPRRAAKRAAKRAARRAAAKRAAVRAAVGAAARAAAGAARTRRASVGGGLWGSCRAVPPLTPTATLAAA